MNSPRPRRARTDFFYCHSGFTLTELLVVIAVIGVLAALLMPVISSTRAKSLQTKCLSNLRQVGNAGSLYAADNGNLLPAAYDIYAAPGVPRSTWIEKLIPYAQGKDKDRVDPKSVFNCPARKPLSSQAQWWRDGMSYAMNTFISAPEWNYRVLVVPEPSKIIWVGEIVETNTEWVRTADGVPPFGAPMAFRHAEDRSNVLFVDGHAEARTREELALDPSSGASLWRWW